MRALSRSLTSNFTYALFVLLGLVLLFFITLPILRTVISTEPYQLWESFLEPDVRSAILLTLYAALVATLIAFVIGVPLAYMLARFNFPGKGVVEGLIDLPIVIPHTAAGIALLMVFGRRMWLGQFFDHFGIRFLGAVPGIVVAMMFVSVPFLVDSAREGFEAVDPRIEKVARTLGASPWYVFWHVTLPLAWRAIMSGAIMMWARGISEFGAVVILVYHPMTAPVLIYERFLSFGLNYSRPVAVLLILICLAIFAVLRMISGRRKRI